MTITSSEASSASSPAAPADPSRAPRGQALVEFAAVLLPILLLVVGIIQFGLIFGANVTLTNAAREGTREATIHDFDLSATRSTNDLDRCTAALDGATQAFGLLSTSAPNFSAARPCPVASAIDIDGDGLDDRWVNGDITVSLCSAMATPTDPCPTAGTYCGTDDPAGCLVQVTITYRSEIIVPFMDAFLPTDGSGRFLQSFTATMAVN